MLGLVKCFSCNCGDDPVLDSIMWCGARIVFRMVNSFVSRKLSPSGPAFESQPSAVRVAESPLQHSLYKQPLFHSSGWSRFTSTGNQGTGRGSVIPPEQKACPRRAVSHPSLELGLAVKSVCPTSLKEAVASSMLLLSPPHIPWHHCIWGN